MGIITSLAIITLAALIHTSFQLSVSVLTLLSSHTLGSIHLHESKKAHRKLLHLSTSFVFGAGIITLLLISFAALVFQNFFGNIAPKILWFIMCGLLISVAIAVWVFYYRRAKGTMLWIPRGVAQYLIERIESTRLGAEAFGLGIVSVLGEILFIVAPITISALVLIELPPMWQLIGIAIYTVISLFSLIAVWVSISSGHSLSRIQKWRENNKYFFQFTAGAGLIVLSFFVYINEIVTCISGVL